MGIEPTRDSVSASRTGLKPGEPTSDSSISGSAPPGSAPGAWKMLRHAFARWQPWPILQGRSAFLTQGCPGDMRKGWTLRKRLIPGKGAQRASNAVRLPARGPGPISSPGGLAKAPADTLHIILDLGM